MTRADRRLFILIISVLLQILLFSTSIAVAQSAGSRIDVKIVPDESEAVLNILSKEEAHQGITDVDWQKLFQSEGYIRLKQREASFHRDFTDDEFRRFVLSDSLLVRRRALDSTLNEWKRAQVDGAATRALAYLPAGSRIQCKIYPEIKPKTNSFVFDITTNPGIFLYVNPAVSREEFENTLAHELHHIGYASSCGALLSKREGDSTIPKTTRIVLNWMSSFGEGFAMLAAAGGPDIHPHAFSKAEDRQRWDRSVLNFNQDLKSVERFFMGVLDSTLTGKAIQDSGFSFFGVQGPWYSVGWKMAVTIERAYGREKLIECICDPRLLLPTYNQAAAEYNQMQTDTLATWSTLLLQRLVH